MFSFFKNNNPSLNELISNNSVDIHSHLLPGIDDGAESIADTAFLLSELNNLGFINFITTPHIITDVWNNTELSIKETFNKHKHIISNNNYANNFEVAAEYMMDNSFLKRLESEQLLTLKENYVLVEMSY